MHLPPETASPRPTAYPWPLRTSNVKASPVRPLATHQEALPQICTPQRGGGVEQGGAHPFTTTRHRYHTTLQCCSRGWGEGSKVKGVKKRGEGFRGEGKGKEEGMGLELISSYSMESPPLVHWWPFHNANT